MNQAPTGSTLVQSNIVEPRHIEKVSDSDDSERGISLEDVQAASVPDRDTVRPPRKADVLLASPPDLDKDRPQRPPLKA